VLQVKKGRGCCCYGSWERKGGEDEDDDMAMSVVSVGMIPPKHVRDYHHVKVTAKL
jgi:hypothetical protein